MTESSAGFTIHTDHYGGVTILSDEQTDDVLSDFTKYLTDGISQWKKEGKRALSIKISLPHSHVIPQCQQLGFDFHHAQPGYVLMVKWLPDEPNTFPEYANQYLGVAGFVVNSKNQVLVIQERYNLGMKHWKLPGGLADKGEGLAETAVREVKEETGVEAEFMSVLAFRHQHNFRWGCSDWYFICLMRPVTEDIVPCPREVAQCKWMDIDEYERDPSLTDANRHFVKCYREARKQGTWALTPTSVLSYNKKFHHDIYSIQPANQNSSTVDSSNPIKEDMKKVQT